jgi:signal peptidase I
MTVEPASDTLQLTRRILNSRGYIRIPSRGISMTPAIKSGDICHFEPLNGIDEARIGDVLLYVSQEGELIGHRFLGTIQRNGETLVVCKGDYNRNPDAPIPPDRVVGRMKLPGLAMRLWGSLISRFPSASVWIQRLYGIRRMR